LHAIRGAVANALSQLPGILALGWTQQSTHIIVGALAGFAAGEMPADALHEVNKFIGPGMDHFWFDIAMLWGRHDPSDDSPSRAIRPLYHLQL
jgi:hypothetical protein